MNFICKSLINNEHFDGGECFVFSISKEYALELLEKRQACINFLVSQGEKYTGKVVLGWQSSMDAFSASILEGSPEEETITAAFEAAESRNSIEVIPDDFDLETYEEDHSYEIIRLRGQQITFYPDGTMRLTSYEKHTGETLESAEFDRAFLEKIANG